MKRLSFKVFSGVCLLQFGRLRVEFWRIPAGGGIPPHVHRGISSRFIFLDRRLCVHRTGSSRTRALPWLRWYHVPAGAVHWAEADRGTARFLNLAWCRGANQSPAEDFLET